MAVKYTEDHEWLDIDGNSATVGITQHAQDALGDVVFVDLPEVGKTFAARDIAGVVESVKAAADVYMPVSGTVTVSNPTALGLTDTQLRVPTRARDEEHLLDPRIPADVTKAIADGYGDITLGPGEPVLPRTFDDTPAPAPGPGAKLLVRFVHLADTQLSDDESPARLANYDEAADGAFRPQEGHLCRMLNAAVRTINRIHVDTPLSFVLLGGDNTDNSQSNELDWFMSILDGAPRVECDSAVDNDVIPGPDNDPKDPFGPVALDVPWRWVTGNHDLLRQGTWPTSAYLGEPIGVTATGGTRDYSQPGSPLVTGTGTVIADPKRAFVMEADQLMRVASAGDGHGITPEALELGRAFYTFDVEGTPLRIFVISTAAATGCAMRHRRLGERRCSANSTHTASAPSSACSPASRR